MAKLQSLFGFHAITSRVRAHPKSVKELFVAEGRQDPRMKDLLKLAEQHGLRVMTVDMKRLGGMAGGGRHQGVVASVDPIQLPQFVDDVLETIEGTPLLLALDGVLNKLEKHDTRKFQVVMLRYFGGLSIEETAAAMDLSPATIKNEWTIARAWLHREMAAS